MRHDSFSDFILKDTEILLTVDDDGNVLCNHNFDYLLKMCARFTEDIFLSYLNYTSKCYCIEKIYGSYLGYRLYFHMFNVDSNSILNRQIEINIDNETITFKY